jgi:hypothetical protein
LNYINKFAEAAEVKLEAATALPDPTSSFFPASGMGRTNIWLTTYVNPHVAEPYCDWHFIV